MNLLLDENLPDRLAGDLTGHQVVSVKQKGWQQKKNGELIRLMLAEKINVLITFDQNLPYQQNLQKLQLIVIVLIAEDNTYQTLKPFVPAILEKLSKNLKAGAYIIQKQ